MLMTGLLVFAACGSSEDEATPSAAPVNSTVSVVTTIYPVTFFAERIGGDRVQVRSLVRPGVEAHDFEPTPDDVIALRAADVFVFVDPSFEGWVEDALSSLGDAHPLVVQTAHLEDDGEDSGDGHEHGGADPHVWLNPVEAAEQVRSIQTALSAIDSAGSEIYRINADALVGELLQLDTDLGNSLGNCELNSIVVSHAAYGHMAERYGFAQLSLADLSAEFESTPRRVADIIEKMRELGVEHILQEPILSDDLAKTIAAETGAEILDLHPLESLTQDERDAGDDYFSVMRRNLSSLKTALKCS